MSTNIISTEALIEKFREALRDNWGYIWGTAGEKWTEAKQRQIEQTTDSDRAQARKYGKKWIGHTVADCSGLFSWAFRQLGGYMYHGSHTMYMQYCTAKGELKSGKRTDWAMLKPGTAVFVWNGSRYSHVGLYVGDGIVIEAMGTVNGVTTSKVSAGKWTHWGELKGVDYAKAASEPIKPTYPTLREGSKGDDVRNAQELLRARGYSIGSSGIDGKFGPATKKAVIAFQKDHNLTPDGVIGPRTWEKLATTDDVITYKVVIKGITKARVDELQKQFPDCEVIKE